jgi:uncharacterized Fe-S cluster-containing radical SAM superfamily protein
METHEETFDAQAEVARIRSRRAVARRKHYRKSRLDRYRAGASCADLAEWLRIRRCRIHRSSIDRYLKRLPELHHAEFPFAEGPG